MTREQKLDAELREILVDLDSALSTCIELQMLPDISWPQRNEYEIQRHRIERRIQSIKYALASEND